MSWTDYKRLLDIASGEVAEARKERDEGRAKIVQLEGYRALFSDMEQSRDEAQALADHFRHRLNVIKAADNQHRRYMDKLFEQPPPGHHDGRVV